MTCNPNEISFAVGMGALIGAVVGFSLGWIWREWNEARKPTVINVRHPRIHEAINAFWECWKENGEPHKHGYYESTWMSINAALSIAGTCKRKDDERREARKRDG